MSNFLAVATVTAALGNLLRKSIQSEEPGAVSGAKVTTVRPEDFDDGAPQPGVNIYLYQTTPNAAWRNADLPTRDSSGQLVQRTQAALDLHFLLTFYGNDNALEPQRLLGSVVRALHSQPLLSREAIRKLIAAINPGDPNDYLLHSNLADQIEMVRFSPIVLNLEELSKLWSVFFQTAYRLSIAYQGSVVLIEGEESPRAALPVAARNVQGETILLPVIEKILSQPDEATAPRENQPILAGHNLIIVGKNLRGQITMVRFDDAEISSEAGLAPQLFEVGDTQIKLKLTSPLPIPESALRAGKHCVQVVHKILMNTPPTPPNSPTAPPPPIPHNAFESNPVFITLRPAIEEPPTVE